MFLAGCGYFSTKACLVLDARPVLLYLLFEIEFLFLTSNGGHAARELS
ncbi:hypothetical protein DESPIG_01465 [Desulfovibrio piger ATCC 29098]|uniref:Uncharacterized protein n=1 Tax=Desulfovibrio piger ATCC 29098 TaxID=411464 RepID=B6WTQ8_9BACT|nr:hypothetical protein DESPIG_01465 [Desulfovibrio piger ATCC 29098]